MTNTYVEGPGESELMTYSDVITAYTSWKKQNYPKTTLRLTISADGVAVNGGTNLKFSSWEKAVRYFVTNTRSV